jgi:hypothetical protein
MFEHDWEERSGNGADRRAGGGASTHALDRVLEREPLYSSVAGISDVSYFMK